MVVPHGCAPWLGGRNAFCGAVDTRGSDVAGKVVVSGPPAAGELVPSGGRAAVRNGAKLAVSPRVDGRGGKPALGSDDGDETTVAAVFRGNACSPNDNKPADRRTVL
jgi:hypothetical protein